MAEVTRPISLRLDATAHDALAARAYRVSGTPAGVARDLILDGLAGADPKGLAERLMQIDRRLTVLESQAKENAESQGRFLRMFEALLEALSEKMDSPSEDDHHAD